MLAFSVLTACTALNTPINTNAPANLAPTAVSTGQWAVYQSVSDANVAVYRILDAGGRSIGALSLPDPVSPKRPWSLIYSPASEFIAAFPYIDQKDSMSSSLLIIKMPDGKVIRDVGQLLPDGTAMLVGTEHQWSPDGRYFTFSAATPGKKLDLFLYDVRKDQVRQLTDQTANLLPWAWSPDGQTILAQEYATKFITINPPDYLGVWAVDLDGKAKRLYVPTAWEDVWKWKSNTVFYVLNDDSGKLTHLRTVDTVSGQVIELYQGLFTYVTMNPPLDEVIFTFSATGYYKVEDSDPGIYRLIGQNKLEKIIDGDYSALAYYKELNMFIGFSNDGQLIGFSFEGTIRLKLPYSDIISSPNGQFIINGVEILTSSGSPVAGIKYGYATWLPDF